MQQTLVVFVFVNFLASICALSCYETTKNGAIVYRSARDWKYCSLLYRINANTKRPIAYGIPKGEEDAHHDAILVSDPPFFSALTSCVHEKYAIPNDPIEYFVRCFCHTDGCNVVLPMEQFFKQNSPL